MPTCTARSSGSLLLAPSWPLRSRVTRWARRSFAVATLTLDGALHAKLGLAAHRGESLTRPENTLAAFAAAKSVADFVEFDVRVSADGRFVVMHDDSVDRTTTGHGLVAELTASEICSLDAGVRFGPAYRGERVPSAEAALAEIVTDAAPMMEFKSGTVTQAVALLSAAPWRSDGLVMNFSLPWLLDLKRALPEVQVGWLGSGTLSDAAIERARAGGVTCVSWRHDDLEADTVVRVGRSGMLLYAWTVNDPGRCAELRASGVDGIVCDDMNGVGRSEIFRSPLDEAVVGSGLNLSATMGRTMVVDSGVLSRSRRKVSWYRESDGSLVGRGGALAWQVDGAGSGGANLIARWSNAKGLAQERRIAVTGASAEGGLSNLSARAYSGDGDATAVVGWVTGSDRDESSTCLLRGVGPTLKAFGLDGVLQTPELRVFRGTELVRRIVGDDTRMSDSNSRLAALGAFALSDNGGDAATLGQFAVGAHTAHLVGRDGRPGVGLLEIYREAGAALHNLSFRGWCPAQGNLVAGFVIEGGGSRLILVRGVGPGLRRFGVGRALADPWIRLFDRTGRVVAASDDWSTDDDAQVVARLLPRTGAPDLMSAGGRDAAIALNLPAGAYTVVLESTDPSTAGVGLIEVFDLAALPEPQAL